MRRFELPDWAQLVVGFVGIMAIAVVLAFITPPY